MIGTCIVFFVGLRGLTADSSESELEFLASVHLVILTSPFLMMYRLFEGSFSLKNDVVSCEFEQLEVVDQGCDGPFGSLCEEGE